MFLYFRKQIQFLFFLFFVLLNTQKDSHSLEVAYHWKILCSAVPKNKCALGSALVRAYGLLWHRGHVPYLHLPVKLEGKLLNL